MTIKSQKTSGSAVVCSAWLAAFRYRPQLKACDSDGTCKRMTPELRAMMQERDQKRYDDIFAFQFPELEKYHGGPRFCGKEPGICSGNHCRAVHFRLADAAGQLAANEKLSHAAGDRDVASGKD